VTPFEDDAIGGGDPLHVGGPTQRAPLERRLGDHVELVLAEAFLRLEEGRGTGQLTDRERRDGLRLARRAHRLLLLDAVEVGVIVV
jgi:hypothetical protein